MFRGEEGLDYGGPAREWFFLLSNQASEASSSRLLNYCMVCAHGL